MSAQSDRIIRFLLEDQELGEGSIIIINGDGGGMPSVDNVNKRNPKGPVRDQFTMDRKGRKWHFAVRRNEFGQISDIDVEEV